MNITSSIQKKDFLTELTKYTFLRKEGDKFIFSAETGEVTEEVQLSEEYVNTFLTSSTYYTETKKVTREDKKNGEPGIRTIFAQIPTHAAFSCIFTKQSKKLKKSEVESNKKAVLNSFEQVLKAARGRRKSMTEAGLDFVKDLLENPVADTAPGEDRFLAGYKTTTESRDGKYMCMDTNINDVRPVNINTLKSLVYNGIKYYI